MPRVETATNQVYRKKYFVDAEHIIGRKQGVPPGYFKKPVRSSVINSARVKLSPKPVRLRKDLQMDDDEDMRVRVTREGTRLKEIDISCPCGRHATLNVAYEDPKQSQ
jgi:hypothetical protein